MHDRETLHRDSRHQQEPAHSYENHTVALHCGVPGLVQPLTTALESIGLRTDQRAPLLVLFDMPRGFAVQQLRSMDGAAQIAVVTNNPCPEYWEDLWELQPAALVSEARIDQTLADAVAVMARGERYRLTPPISSALTSAERILLRYVARGWDNRQIARRLDVEEKSVRNRLTRVYTKLKVSNRVQAALYYWGRDALVK